MTQNDVNLLKEARLTKYWEYFKIKDLIKLADAQVTRGKLNNIYDLLRDVNDQGYKF